MIRSFYLHRPRAFVWTLIALLAGCGGGGGGNLSQRYDPAAFPLFELAPEVSRVLQSDDHNAHMALNYLRYARALVAGGDALDAIVAVDARLNDLEPQGFTVLLG